MLEIQIVSDLHVEFWSAKQKFNFVKPTAPILALLGDICCCGTDEDFGLFKRFINEILPQYQTIILVSGNHEYYYNSVKKSLANYSNTIQGIDEKIKTYFKATSDKLHYLNNNSISITINKQSYLLIGSTLWTWIPEEQRAMIQDSMNDYRYILVTDNEKIRPITSTDVANMHLRNYKYIKSQITKAKKTKQKVIVLTHHKPYLSATFDANSISVAYESNLSQLFTAPVVLWAYGHTHIADSSVIGKTLLYSNPKGYPSQKTKYNKTAIVKV